MAAGAAENDERLQFKQREPGLIRLAFETVVAQICLNANAQYTI